VVLIGDAATASDPSWGNGMSLTLRDVRVLHDQIPATGDYDVAGHAYAAEHDRYYTAVHRINTWLTDLEYTPGPEAAARRARVWRRWAEEPSRFPDPLGRGPDGLNGAEELHSLG
jgi:2-polyprenyl-6-methoxyphenol hydroxylase-like FAD-dependent oxidoreductase